METGFRHDTDGALIPRDIITSFTCTYNGEEVFERRLLPAIAANPFITFHDGGDRERHARLPLDRRQRLQTQTETAKITVE